MKLNIGCGTDYREGYVNVDGSEALPRVDRVIPLENGRLLAAFGAGSCTAILANDIVEHFTHWEGVALMKEFHTLLKPGAQVEIRVPDAFKIIYYHFIGIRTKLLLLFGGQDIPQGRDAEMDVSRQKHPEYFCHKFGWTRKRMKMELEHIGFHAIRFSTNGFNFVVTATRPS
jgi:hypothetical protein